MNVLEQLVTGMGAESVNIGDAAEPLTIDQVRTLYAQVYRLRDKSNHLVVPLYKVDAMSLPAQNALLKMIEEPPLSVSFLLFSKNPDHVLATIRSRSQHLHVAPHTLADFVSALGDTPETRQQYFATDGDLTRALLESSTDSLKLGKTFLSLSGPDRIIWVNQSITSKQQAVDLVTSLMQLCRTAIRTVHSTHSRSDWLARSEAVLKTSRTVEQGTAYKLAIARLAASLV
jgi:hypothetical protein